MREPRGLQEQHRSLIGVRVQAETIAEQLGCAVGHWTIEFRLENGRLVRTYVHRGPIRNDELDGLAGRSG